jgi:hypothetical protein
MSQYWQQNLQSATQQWTQQPYIYPQATQPQTQVAPAPLAATVVTLTHTNTLTLAATTAYQLVTQSTGGCYFGILNLGAGNLFVRFDAAPTGASDAAAFEQPANLTVLVQYYVPNGKSGLYILADAAGKASVLVTSK